MALPTRKVNAMKRSQGSSVSVKLLKQNVLEGRDLSNSLKALANLAASNSVTPQDIGDSFLRFLTTKCLVHPDKDVCRRCCNFLGNFSWRYMNRNVLQDLASKISRIAKERCNEVEVAYSAMKALKNIFANTTYGSVDIQILADIAFLAHSDCARLRSKFFDLLDTRLLNSKVASSPEFSKFIGELCRAAFEDRNETALAFLYRSMMYHDWVHSLVGVGFHRRLLRLIDRCEAVLNGVTDMACALLFHALALLSAQRRGREGVNACRQCDVSEESPSNDLDNATQNNCISVDGHEINPPFIPFDVSHYLFYVELFCLVCSDAGARYLLNESKRAVQIQRWLHLPSLCPIRESVLAAIGCSTRNDQFMRALATGGSYNVLCEQLLPVVLKFHRDPDTVAGCSHGDTPRMLSLWDTFWQKEVRANRERAYILNAKVRQCVEEYLLRYASLSTQISKTRCVCAGVLPSIWPTCSTHPSEVETLDLSSVRSDKVYSSVFEHCVFHIVKALAMACASGPLWRPIDSKLVSLLLDFFFTPVPSVNLLPVFSVLIALIESNKGSVHLLLVERMPSRLLEAFTEHRLRSAEMPAKLLPGQQIWQVEFDAVYASLCKQLLSQAQYLLDALKPMSVIERQRIGVELLHLSSYMHTLRAWFDPDKPRARIFDFDFDTDDEDEKRRLQKMTCLAVHYIVSNRGGDDDAATARANQTNEFYSKITAVEKMCRETPARISSTVCSIGALMCYRVGLYLFERTSYRRDDPFPKMIEKKPQLDGEDRLEDSSSDGELLPMGIPLLPETAPTRKWPSLPNEERTRLTRALLHPECRCTWPPPCGMFSVKITFADGCSARKYDLRVLQLESFYFDRLLRRQYLKASRGNRPVPANAFNVFLANVGQKAFDTLYELLDAIDRHEVGTDDWRQLEGVSIGHVLLLADQFLFVRLERYICQQTLISGRIGCEDLYEIVWAGVTINNALPVQIGVYRSFRHPFLRRSDYDCFIKLCELAVNSAECRKHIGNLLWLDVNPLNPASRREGPVSTCW